MRGARSLAVLKLRWASQKGSQAWDYLLDSRVKLQRKVLVLLVLALLLVLVLTVYM